MMTVIGVRFKKAGKVYFFDPNGVWPNPGEYVVVETARGLELGEVVTSAREVDDAQVVSPLKKVIRPAVAEDIQRMEFNEKREKETYHIAQERIAHHKLDMKLVDVEYTFDNSKIVFYFTANGRVDFRDLVKDLAGVFKMRIELRQIGVRDEAKMLGGLGSCGRPICCGAFLSDFQPVSIKMAKEQNLSLNPTKISGQCGRLMCCLKYEQDYYESALKRLPKIGRECITPDGVGIIYDINVIREKVRVKIRTEDTIDVREYPLADVSKPQPGVPGQEGHPTGEAAKQRQIEGARRSRPSRPAPAAPKDSKEAEKPDAQQEKQEQQRQRRIASKNKSKQMSTDQFMDKLTNGGGKGKKGEPKQQGEGEAAPRPARNDPGFGAGIPTAEKPSAKIQPGEKMNS